MKQADKSFNQVFEHYVYKVASQSIDLADAATQADLINLLTEVSRSADPTATVPGLAPSEPTEWEQVLNQPVDWRLVHQQGDGAQLSESGTQ